MRTDRNVPDRKPISGPDFVASTPRESPEPKLTRVAPAGVGRRRPALGDGVPPAGGDGVAGRRAGAAAGCGAAGRAAAGRRALLAPREAHAHGR